MTMEEVIGYYEKQKITVLDHYVALILAGLIANEGVDDGPLGAGSDFEYPRMVQVAFEIADLCIIERREYGVEK